MKARRVPARQALCLPSGRDRDVSPRLGRHKEAIEGSATDLSRDRVSLRLDLSFGSIVVMQENGTAKMPAVWLIFCQAWGNTSSTL